MIDQKDDKVETNIEPLSPRFHATATTPAGDELAREATALAESIWSDQEEVRRATNLTDAWHGIDIANGKEIIEFAERYAATRIRSLIAEVDDWKRACMEAREGCNQRSSTIRSLRKHLTASQAQNATLREALEPFAGDKLPSTKRTKIEYDRYGLRRIISPMEIASRNAFLALYPEEHPLAKKAAREAKALSTLSEQET